VWITVEAPDSDVRTIVVTWGAWQRRIVHEGSDVASYRFTKDPGATVPIVVDVEPDAVVTFGSGTPPPDSEDVNAGWTSNVG
jgi:hypothetical protein